MAWVSCQTKLSYKYRRRTHTVTPTLEESYLRVDVSCASEACDTCRVGLAAEGGGSSGGGIAIATPTSSLSAAAPYYLVPDDAALSDLLEMFELPDISNYIILSSCLKQVSLQSGRKASRVRALYRDRRRRAVLFDDLHCLDTSAAASGADPSLPPALAAGLFYARHLGGRVPLVVVSDRMAEWMAAAAAAGGAGPSPGEDSALLDNLALAAAEGVLVLSAAEYVGRFWPQGSAVSELYDSLMAAKLAAATAPPDGDAAYPPHLLQQEVEEGLAAGSLLRGVVHISRRNPREAVVELGHGPDAALGRLVRVSGRTALNRAIEGDVVAVRLVLPGGPQLPDGTPGVTTAAATAADEDAEAAGGGDGAPEAAAAAGAAAAADPDADFGAELLADAEGNGAGGEEGALAMMETGSSAALPSAEVVAILQRDPRDVVACLSQRDEAALRARLEQQAQHPGGGGGAPQRRSEMLVCMPLDRRLPAVVVVTRQGAQLMGCRFVVRVDTWERHSRYPRGHVSRVLGRLNDLRAESDAVLVQCGIHYKPFCEAAMLELPRVARPEDWWVPPLERTTRRDLTGPDYFVVSIDPVGCTDVDDAMHVRFLPPAPPAPRLRRRPPQRGPRDDEDDDGGDEYDEYDDLDEPQQRVEVGVHIADVSFFVAAGGMLDGEARDRCTSVYLVDRRLDMLPGLLSEQLCSLRQGVERLAVSVIWTLRRRRRRRSRRKRTGTGRRAGGEDTDEAEEEARALDGIEKTVGEGAWIHGGGSAEAAGEQVYEYEVEDVWYGRTIIRSRHQLHYQQAQDILDGRPPAPGDELPLAHVAELRRSLRVLDELTAQLHARRVAAGALELASAELRFQIDPDTGAPCQVVCKQKIPMMDVVAEMMIAANSAVAERIATAFPGCALLRNHPPPRAQAFEQVRALIEPHAGPTPVDPTSNASLAAALERACAAAAASDPAAATLIKSLATRAMSEAQYNSSGTTPPGTPLSYHYGLALQYYTHFTSPIRRYADVVVHRQLLAALSESPPPLLHPDLAAAAATMNARHRQAKAAQKECSELYLLLLLHSRPHVERALVCGLSGSRLELFVPTYHLRGTVALTDRRGLPRLPLRPGEPEGAAAEEDPFLAAERRGLRLSTSPEEASITDAVTGQLLWRVRLWDSVSVRLSASDHRAHGPKLALRLLDPCHPEALPPSTSPRGAVAVSIPPPAVRPPAVPAAVAGPPLRPPPLVTVRSDRSGQAAGGDGGGAAAATAALPPHLRLLIGMRDKAVAAAASPDAAVSLGAGVEPDASTAPSMQTDVCPGSRQKSAPLGQDDASGKELIFEADADAGVLGAPAPALVATAAPQLVSASGTPPPPAAEASGNAAARCWDAGAAGLRSGGSRPGQGDGAASAAAAGALHWQLPEVRSQLKRISRLEMRLSACRRGSKQERNLRERLDELKASVRQLQA